MVVCGGDGVGCYDGGMHVVVCMWWCRMCWYVCVCVCVCVCLCGGVGCAGVLVWW